MTSTIEQHWLFAAICFFTTLLMLRLVLSERITLQSSLSSLVLLAFGAAMALFPRQSGWVAVELGFEIPSNFFFAASIFALAVLHVHSLVMSSRVTLRSVTLTQELAILQERIDRLQQQLVRRDESTQ